MKPTSEPRPPSELAVIAVDHLPEYVIGFPVHVAVTIRAGKNTSFNALLFADLTGLRECIGMEMIGRDGSTAARYVPKPIIEPELGLYGDRLRAGESRRMLTDVSPIVGAAIAEGEYEARFSYVSPETKAEAAPVRLRFRKPTAQEAGFLAGVAGDRARFANWALWTTTRPAGLVYGGRIEEDNLLRFNLLLRWFFYGSQPLTQVDPAMLEVLTGLYEPEREALKAEIYHARGDTRKYQDLKSMILGKDQGLEWWIRMIDEGGAFLKTFRVDVDGPSPQ